MNDKKYISNVVNNNTNALLSSANCTLPQKKSLKQLIKNIFQKNTSVLNELSVDTKILVKKQAEKYGKHLENVNLVKYINKKALKVVKILSKTGEEIIAYDLSKLDGEHFLQTHSTNPLLRSETIDKAIENYPERLTK